MSKVARLLGATAALCMATFGYCQADSQEKPLGDIARELREHRKQRVVQATRVYSDDDMGSASDVAVAQEDSHPGKEKKAEVETHAADSKDKKDKTEEKEKADSTAGNRPRSVLDRKKDATPDVMVIPKGTQIRVNYNDEKVIVPVRVGFATAIPALSPAHVRVARTYLQTYPNTNPAIAFPVMDYADYATLDSVTVGGQAYAVQSDVVPLLRGGTNSEMVFTLTEPLSIPY